MNNYKKEWFEFNKTPPLIDLCDVSPFHVFNNPSFKKIFYQLTDIQRDGIKSVYEALNTLSMSNNSIFSLVDDVTPLLKNKHGQTVTIDTTRRRFEIMANCRLVIKNQAKVEGTKRRFTVYSLVAPGFSENEPQISISRKHKVNNAIDIDESEMLAWAQNTNLKHQDQKILFGQRLLQIMSFLLPLTKPRNGERKKTLRIPMFGNYITATISTTNDVLPTRKILKEYFAALECIKLSMKANISNGESVLSKQTFMLPVTRQLEVLGKENQTYQRTSLINTMRELNSLSIELDDLPFKELQKESFISFSPVSNLSYFVKKHVDSIRATGKGTSVVVFSLPMFVIDSLAQQINSENHLVGEYKLLSAETEYPYSQHFVENLYNLPSEWINNSFDDLVLCLGLMVSESEMVPEMKYMSWDKIKQLTNNTSSIGKIKTTFFKLAEKKGATLNTSKLVLYSSIGLTAVFDEYGIKLENIISSK